MRDATDKDIRESIQPANGSNAPYPDAEIRRVGDILLELSAPMQYPWMPTDGSRVDKRGANKFMLCQMAFEDDLDVAWRYTEELAEKTFGDPEDLWSEILDKLGPVRALLPSDNPRRSDAIAARIMQVARYIKDRYGGDVRAIWADDDGEKAFQRLLGMKIDRSISEDIVFILYETRQLKRWPWMPTDGSRASRRDANKFFAGAVMDYRMKAWLVWKNAKRLSEGILGDPDDLWEAIRGRSEAGMREMFRAESLHRFPDCGVRLWRAAGDIGEKYEGDVRRIWEGKTTVEALKSLQEFYGIGPQLGRMIVGALKDTKQIVGNSDLKADTNVRKVLGRVFEGKSVSPSEALEIADAIVPGNSWSIDDPLFSIGTRICRASDPLCSGCPLKGECVYAQTRSRMGRT